MNRTCYDCKHGRDWQEYGVDYFDCEAPDASGPGGLMVELVLTTVTLKMRGAIPDAAEFLGMNCHRFLDR